MPYKQSSSNYTDLAKKKKMKINTKVKNRANCYQKLKACAKRKVNYIVTHLIYYFQMYLIHRFL